MMNSFNGRTLVEQLVVEGLDDWAYPSWVLGRVSHSGVMERDLLRAGGFGLIAEVMFRGLMVPGDIIGKGHVPWSCSTGEALERIVNEWLTEWGDEIPTPGAIVWLANTPKGDELAHAVLAREEASR